MSAKEFSQLVYGSTGWRGAYPLVIPMEVGDYFEIGRNDLPVYLGNVHNWPGWREALPVDSDSIAGSETYHAGSERKTTVEASGGVTHPVGLGADATLALSFSRSAGFVLAHDAGRHNVFRDVASVKRHVLQWTKETRYWQENWILVTEVIASDSATLVVSTESQSSINLHANVSVPSGLAGVGIADPKLGWTASSWRGSGYSSICKPGTPLYHCVRVRRDWLGRLHSELLDAGAVDPDEVFTDDPFEGTEG